MCLTTLVYAIGRNMGINIFRRAIGDFLSHHGAGYRKYERAVRQNNSEDYKYDIVR